MISSALRYFLQVANCGSVTSAAEILHVAPSAVSRQIQSLEQKHGTALFERNARGMRLTETGELLAVYARRAILESERVSEEISARSRLGRSTIRIAANEGFGRELIPHAIGEFRKISPEVTFDMRLVRRTEVRKVVMLGEVDLGMAYSMLPTDGVDVIFSKSAPLYAVMSPTHPLANREILSLQDIAAHDVVMSGADSSTRTLVDYCCMRARIELNYVFISDYSGALQHYIRDFQAITLAGKLAVWFAVERGDVVAIPLTDSDIYDRMVQIYTMQGRQLPRSVEAFAELLIQMASP
ncbi:MULTISPECIES: LysR family transcriptional regulator [Achromobacter]|uniref:LysR family transcriptional regulator n=1 Tax=Achromobacter spanius TaxID=217203 RepID=A0ABY8GY68_9BURK|nr:MULTISPECIES: LysR family transcriptional regulator [Achromobacter]WAI80927.1 LysR family transcriptional regulator [Achromobacter spanius]WEX96442.1 LysR family transcriptional regulator [Achromobacter sp. SS2-2022]WFP09840.1 LysR family transcriptional regulator [Achromobacter spanius]